MTERITMISTAGVIQKSQSNANKDKDSNQTLVLGATGAGKTTFQVKSLLKSIDLLKQK